MEGHGRLLYKFLQQPMEKLKPYIEHRKDCVAAFLRAFFDGERSIRKRRLTVCNTDKQLLAYVKGLLKKYFDIDATGPHLKQRSGTIMHCPHAGKLYKTTKDCYQVNARANSLRTFCKNIGFTIKRKQRRLAEAAKQ